MISRKPVSHANATVELLTAWSARNKDNTANLYRLVPSPGLLTTERATVCLEGEMVLVQASGMCTGFLHWCFLRNTVYNMEYHEVF